MITKENILSNIELNTIKVFNDGKDDWHRTATKYQCKLTYNHQEYVFDYWMGAAHTKAPSKKDVLYSMVMDDTSGMDFQEFCWSFGYDEDSRTALKTFEACQEQTKNFKRLFNEEEREILRELLEDY